MQYCTGARYFRSCCYKLPQHKSIYPYVGIIRIRSIGRNVNPFPLSRNISSLLNFILAAAIYISQSQHIATKYGEIVMITIAAYTFYKITITVIKAVKQRKNPSPLLSVIRSISYAEVAASVLTLQRSMLVSFGEMNDTDIHTMNTLTGSSVCLFVLILGIALIIRGAKRKE